MTEYITKGFKTTFGTEVTIVRVFNYFYIITGNLNFILCENVPLSDNNYVKVNDEWHPIEDFNWISSDTKLDDPVGEWISKLDD